jgi:hypothetical protein
MILNFENYNARGWADHPIDPVIIVPGMFLHVRRNIKDVQINGLPGSSNNDNIAAVCDTERNAIRLFEDINKFLQYRDCELPEYKL